MKNTSRTFLPEIRSTAIPGPKSRALAKKLLRHECPNITLINKNTPIVWEKAQGANVWDVDGNRYLDLTAGFGVAQTGHTNSSVVKALMKQAQKLLHSLSDVYPDKSKIQLLERLSKIFPSPLEKIIFGSSGAEAVEIAIKTAFLATGKSGLITFEGSYHGMSYGALKATNFLNLHQPFKNQLGLRSISVSYPHNFTSEQIHHLFKKMGTLFKKNKIGAVLIEPIQGRGGIRMAPPLFIKGLRHLCNQYHVLLIADEIYSGMGRTGFWFAFQASDIVPDIMTIGKGLSGGFPISACIGTRKVMSHWPRYHDEALHTSTFMASPLGCAMALRNLQEIQKLKLIERARILGEKWILQLRKLQRTYPCIGEIRGRGLMIGVEIVQKNSRRADPRRARDLVTQALREGVIFLSDGMDGNVLIFTPPLSISEKQLGHAYKVIEKCLSAQKN
ncbi:MAG: aspartate aminotransferase family protein [Chlamydiae bacterium]|nr:aspartate aminotransferase family protein [Chlamydiota bacterium]MBI3265490.1 aspartate aminotransferase family protein [Chlamydiota bacterium]